jgi:uncharacterized membrane protein
MSTMRLEAFSDGVIAILITIMVLELKVPNGADWAALEELLPVFLIYVSSFIFIGIYWNNHHHMLHATSRINGKIRLAAAVGRDVKGKISPVLYAVAVAAAFVHQWISDAIYVAVALMWLVPDKRIERELAEGEA